MERRISSVVSIGLLALLSGCGGGGGSSSPSPSPGPPPVDTTPDGFSFASQAGSAPSTSALSNEVTITGLNGSAAVTIVGGEYSINGGAFTSAAGTISNNQRIQVRISTAGQFATRVSATLTIGGVAVTFSVTTREVDAAPDGLRFPAKADVGRDAWVISDAVDITGIDLPVTVTIENGEYSINGGTFTSAVGTVSEGQSLRVRARAGSTYSKVTRARLTAGSVTADFEVIAELPAYNPDEISFDGTDVVYLLSSANRTVFRWSVAAAHYLDPYVLSPDGVAPTRMALARTQHRLYLGYGSGEIRYIDMNAATVAESSFATLPAGISSLGDAGNYIVAQGAPYNYESGVVLSGAGVVTAAGGYYYGYSRATEWDASSGRVYHFRDGLSPNDLHFDVIDQVTGQVSSHGETPYHGHYNIQGPIRVSVGGDYVLLGSGDIYKKDGLAWTGTLGSVVADARWFADGSIASLTTGNNQTVLRRLAGPNLVNVEQLTYAGQALRIAGTDQRMAVVLLSAGTVKIHTYIPTDDSDGDGVPNTTDAFPLDAAASVDADHDGYPEAWNSGRTQADSTTGLSLDTFPQDSACWLPAHGSGGTCDYSATIPGYRPDVIEQHGDIIYLMSTANRRVYRWSISGGQYLNPYVPGVNQGFTTLAPTAMTLVSSQQRLYLGYANGSIRYIDVSGGNTAEVAFANLPYGVSSLSSAGNFLLAQAQGGYDNGYILNSSGTITGQGGYYYGYSRETAWDPATSRVYYMRDGISPNDLHYDVIDQNSGVRTATAETPYHGDYSVGGVIRLSPNGQSVLLGVGDFYNTSTMTWAGTLGANLTDARWLANGSLATLVTSGNHALLRRLSSGSLVNLEQLSYAGEALRVVGSDAAMVVLVMNNGTVQFHHYAPSDDADGDGVSSAADAFPLDRAAAVDTDHDGRPDAWNAGMSQADSTTGLALDAYPLDSGCWLVSHGSGAVCNPGSSVPDFVADQVVVNGDVIYLLSGANDRVYRWSMNTAAYLNPWVVGRDNGFAPLSAQKIAYSEAHQRLYVGYGTGEIRSLNVNAANPAETVFTIIPSPIVGLISAGNFLVADLGYYYYAGSGTRMITSGGVVVASGHTLTSGGEYTWDPVTSRLYYAGPPFSSALYYQEIDQGTGEVVSWAVTMYQGTLQTQPPARVSADGEHIGVGSGDIFARDLTWDGLPLGKSIEDAHWKDNILVTVDSTDLVEIRDATTRQVLQSYQYTGQPQRLAFGTTEGYLVHVLNGATAFVRLPFYDQDGDQIPRWWEQLYANGGAGMSDTNPADANTDLDGDGVSNRDEYLHHSSPLTGDTDGDGLGDAAEIDTWHTHPLLADTDEDGLSDNAEVVTHLTDPLDADSDDDGYSDLIEVLQGGDPNDVAGLPTALGSYTQTFEDTPDLAAWYSPRQNGVPWALDTTVAHGGAASFKSGALTNAQSSVARLRGYFRAGQLSFWSKSDAGYCCNYLYVLIDGVHQLSGPASTIWNQYTIDVPAGIHEIEWRYEKYYYGTVTSDAAWIDDVVFTAP